MQKVSKEDKVREKNKHAIPPELWRGNDASLFEPPPIISDSVERAAWAIVGGVRKTSLTLLRKQLRSVESAYRRGRREHDKPVRDWYLNQYRQLGKAVDSVQNELSSIKGIAREILARQIASTLKDEPVKSIKGFQTTFEMLSVICASLVKEFETEKTTSIMRDTKAGARESAHIRYSASELIAVWEKLTREKFIYNFDNAESAEGSLEFLRPCVQFVFVVLRGFDEGMTVNSVKHAILSQRKISGQKLAPRKL